MLAIIIVSYRSNERTIKYVREEICKIRFPHKVVIVSNSNYPGGDQTLCEKLNAELVLSDYEGLRNSDIYVLSNPENSGYAIGNNMGARFAVDCLGAEYLLISNNDIIFLDSDVADKLINKISGHPEIGLIGPKIVGLDGNLQSPEPYLSFWNRHIFMYLSTIVFPLEKKIRYFKLDYSKKAEEGFHYKLMGSFFLTRARDFMRCGLMDEKTFLYSEEVILTERMKRIGLGPYYLPSVAVLHEHEATTSKNFERRCLDKMMFDSECYYYRTYKKTCRLIIFIGKVMFFIRQFLSK